jgi:hypothetical protein
MKRLLTVLLNQILNNVEYLKDGGYICRDTFELISLQKYPFINVYPNPVSTISNEQVANISKSDMERYIYSVIIQFAQRSLYINTAIMGDDIKKVKGVLDIYQDIWDAIKFDTTIGGAVNGIVPGSVINFDVIQDTIDKYYLAAGELSIQFYVDKGLK